MDISILALLISFYALYKNRLERADIHIYLGDSLGIVRHNIRSTSTIQLACVLANLGAKVGVLNRLVLKIHDDKGNCHNFMWHQFIKHEDVDIVNGLGEVHPIPVLGKDVCFQRIEFEGEELRWTAGTYKLELNGWYNINCSSGPNILVRQSFTVDENDQLLLAAPTSHASAKKFLFNN